jgi:hypothetical protein
MKKTQYTRKTKLTDPLYTYVRPTSGLWVRKQAEKVNQTYSQFIDNLIQFGKKKGFKAKITRTAKTASKTERTRTAA